MSVGRLIPMPIRLLPATLNSVDPSQATPDVSTSLVPLTQRAITTRAGQITLVPSADTFSWSSSTRRAEANVVYGKPIEDSQNDQSESSRGEYVSGWVWGRPVESTAIAHYLSNAAGPAARCGQLIDLYA